jgi:hypothetical protein
LHSLQLGADTQLFFLNAKHLTDADYVAAQRIRARLATHFRAAFEVADVIVTPTTPCAAPLVPPGANSYGEGWGMEGLGWEVHGGGLGLGVLLVGAVMCLSRLNTVSSTDAP